MAEYGPGGGEKYKTLPNFEGRDGAGDLNTNGCFLVDFTTLAEVRTFIFFIDGLFSEAVRSSGQLTSRL